MAIMSYDDFVQRIEAGFSLQQPWYDELQTAATTSFLTNQTFACHRAGYSKALPSLPGGVSAIIPTRVTSTSSTAGHSFLVAKLINLGSLDISGASGTFTDGSAMPSQTVLGVASQTVASAVIIEVTTALNATPGTFTFTYVDQSGNGSETTAAMTPAASSVARTVGFATLNSGDWGVRDITAAARAAGTTPSGTLKFWGAIPISFMAASPSTAGQVIMDNLVTSSFMVNRLSGADVIGVFAIATSAVKASFGDIFMVGDS